MREYKFLFKMIMSYLLKHGSGEDYIKQHKDILKIFSCDGELILHAMSVYYGVDIDISRLICDEIIQEEIRIIKSLERTRLIMDGWCLVD